MSSGAKLRLIYVLLGVGATASSTAAILVRSILVRALLLTVAVYFLLTRAMVLYTRLYIRFRSWSRTRRGLCVICGRPRDETSMVCSSCMARYQT